MFDRLPEPVFMALAILAIVLMLVGAFAMFGGLLFVALGAPSWIPFAGLGMCTLSGIFFLCDC